MPDNIFLIGPGVEGFREHFESKGHRALFFETASEAGSALEDAALVIFEKSQEKSDSELIRKSAGNVPKIVVSADGKTRGIASWLKEPYCYPLFGPSGPQLVGFASRIIREKGLIDSAVELETRLEYTQQEVIFFEEINRMLTSSATLNEILELIMKRVKEMTQAEAWSILMVDEETGDLIFQKTLGRVRKKIDKVSLKLGEGIAGWVAEEGVPVVVPDVASDPRFSSRMDQLTHLDTRTLMCVPVKAKGQIMAVLEVVNKKDGGVFDETDLTRLMRLVDQAALAMESATLHSKMEELVVTDDLTKLFNTRYMHRTIETEVMRSNRYHTSLSLIFMDIDYFKQINDTYGHLVGSKVLVEMAQLLLKHLRSIDIVARYGGDEFVIVLPQTAPGDGVRIAERIRRAIEKHVFMKKEKYNLKITSSFGVASYPESAKTKEDLMRIADEAMYRVKHSTRNGVFAIM